MLFYRCSNLENVIFNSSFKTIGERAFYECSSLSKIHFPNGLYQIGSYVKSVTSIKSGKYSTTVAIPNPKNFNEYTVTAKTSKDDTDITADATVMYEESAPMLKTLTMQHGSTEYNLTTTNGTKPNVVFNPSYGFKFSAKFDNTENLDNVYIVSTRNNQKKYMYF